MSTYNLGKLKVIDLTKPLDPKTETRRCHLFRFNTGGPIPDFHTIMDLTSHLGTHVECPYHHDDNWPSAAELPLTTLKLHQLQLIRHTRMALEFERQPEDFHLFTVDEYIDLVIDFIERLDPAIALERFVSQSPKELLIAPDWGLKNYEFTARVNRRLAERDSWQGKCRAKRSL